MRCDPRASECENLLVPVCLSASHIAYGSIRMGTGLYGPRPTHAAMAATLANEKSVSVQQIDYPELLPPPFSRQSNPGVATGSKPR